MRLREGQYEVVVEGEQFAVIPSTYSVRQLPSTLSKVWCALPQLQWHLLQALSAVKLRETNSFDYIGLMSP